MYFKNVCRRLIIFCLLILSQKSLASAQLGLDYGTLRMSHDGETVSSIERSTLDGYVSVGLNRGSTILFYLGYLQVDHVEKFSDGTYQSAASTQPYAGFGYLIKDNDLPIGIGFSVAYSPVAKLSLSQPSGVETWEGASTLIKVGFNVKVSRRIKLVTSLMHVNESYNNKISGTLTERSSFNQSFFAPSIGIAADY